MLKWFPALVPLMATAAFAQYSPPQAAEYAEAGKRCAAGEAKACQKLLRVAIEDENGVRGVAAGWWLGDPGQLAEVARKAVSPEVRVMAVRKLSDQELLSRITREDKSPYVRRVALGRVRDRALIREMALHEKDESVRLVAIEALWDQDALREIIESETTAAVRLAAVRSTRDQSLLVSLANADRDAEVATLAASRVHETVRLAEIARQSRYRDARRSAVSRLMDMTVLAEIVGGDADESVRHDALLRLRSYPQVLVEAARSDPAESVRLAAVDLLVSRSRAEDGPLFVQIAQHDASASVRAAAVGQLTDPALRARLAQEDANARVRLAALKGIDDVVLLARVGKDDIDPDVRRAALEKLAALPTLPAPLDSDRALADALRTFRKAEARRKRVLKLFPIAEGGYGSPTGAFAALGVQLHESKSYDSDEGFGVELAADIGQDTRRLRLGYVFPGTLAGVGVSGFVAQGGGSLEGKTYVGGELDLSLFSRPFDILHGRAGVMTQARDFGKGTAFTWGVSLNVAGVVAFVIAILHYPCIGCT
jgi:hypothetical protein